MIDYMADRSSFDIDPGCTTRLTVNGTNVISNNHIFKIVGRDLDGLLFNFLDEILLTVVSEPYLAIKEIKIVDFQPKSITFDWYSAPIPI